MITKRKIYELICDLSMEIDVLTARFNALERKVKALEDKPNVKVDVKRGRGRPRKEK